MVPIIKCLTNSKTNALESGPQRWDNLKLKAALRQWSSRLLIKNRHNNQPSKESSAPTKVQIGVSLRISIWVFCIIAPQSQPPLTSLAALWLRQRADILPNLTRIKMMTRWVGALLQSHPKSSDCRLTGQMNVSNATEGESFSSHHLLLQQHLSHRKNLRQLQSLTLEEANRLNLLNLNHSLSSNNNNQLSNSHNKSHLNHNMNLNRSNKSNNRSRIWL